MDAPPEAGGSLVRALAKAARAIATRVEPTLKAEGLTLDQWLVLDALAGSSGATMTELGTDTRLTGPTLTRVVDRLVMTALAFREVDAADRRRVRVYLSPRGRGAHRRVSGKLTELERTLLAGTDTPGTLVTSLGQLAE
jgi:MarR family transcriptional regulator, organic hydroperoxide resistance regulator